MNHTKNYNLPQWELNDLIRMEDFNSMNASIENGLTSTAEDASFAKTTAETARRTAVVAYSPSNKPYATGSYTGDGAQVREFNLGFQPSFLLICHSQLTYKSEFAGLGMAMAGPNVNSKHIYLTAQGFRLENLEPVNVFPDVNVAGKTYNYIAFR